MTTTKILFTDLDGTLLNDQHQVSEGNRKAMEKALAKGHKIVIATGRPIASARLLAQELGLTGEGCYIIASNGALLYDTYNQKVLQERSLPLSFVRPMFDSAYEEGLHIHTYSHTNVLSERDTKEVRWYEKAIRVPAMIIDDVPAYLTYDPIKIILINYDEGSRQRLEAFQQKMVSFTEGKMTSIFSSDIMLEYCPLNVSKGEAVRNLCKLLEIPIEDSIAAGDAENDISMIQAAGCGCVMCNGSEETKKYADYITKNDNNHDGFAEIVERFML